MSKARKSSKLKDKNKSKRKKMRGKAARKKDKLKTSKFRKAASTKGKAKKDKRGKRISPPAVETGAKAQKSEKLDGLTRKQAKLPYRPCAGLAVFNKHGHVFVGRRTKGPEHMEATHVWQMPQGGIDPGEDAYDAAIRELYEETNIRSVKLLGTIKDWLKYDLPAHRVGRAWKGKYRGQKQKWFALLFTGKDKEIDVRHPGGGHHKPEFVEWRWEPIDNLPKVVVPFKRETYKQIVKEFRKYAKPTA
jgi:putative (di)nucleoside polyphosphate hydrolase